MSGERGGGGGRGRGEKKDGKGKKGGGPRGGLFRARPGCQVRAGKFHYIKYKNFRPLSPLIPEPGKNKPRRGSGTGAERIGQLEIEIGRRVGDNDTLYGWVTSADVAAALKAKGFEVDKRKIQLPEPLKALGETSVPIKIHHGVVAQVKVRVVAEKK